MMEANFGGAHWGLSFRRDYLVYIRVRSWSLFLREPRDAAPAVLPEETRP